MKSGSTISFIGAGNLAWHLAQALDNTEYAVREIFSREAKNARELVSKLYEAEIKTNLDFSSSSSSIFILAIPDDKLKEIAQQLLLPSDAILLHTSGAKPLEILSEAHTPNFGVLYPLQTFTKPRKINFEQIPLFIEGSNKQTEKTIKSLGKSISKNVIKLNSQDRRILHLAAVFSSNFTNHMLTIAEDILKANRLDYDWIKPLLVETINKSLSLGPSASQTGPAKRNDLETLDKHLKVLKGNKELQKIYKLLSQHIMDWHADKK